MQITECVSPSEMSHCYSCASDIYGCEAKWFLLFSVTLRWGFHLLAEHRHRLCLFRFLWYALYLLHTWKRNLFLISNATQGPQKDFIDLEYYSKCALHKDDVFSTRWLSLLLWYVHVWCCSLLICCVYNLYRYTKPQAKEKKCSGILNVIKCLCYRRWNILIYGLWHENKKVHYVRWQAALFFYWCH